MLFLSERLKAAEHDMHISFHFMSVIVHETDADYTKCIIM